MAKTTVTKAVTDYSKFTPAQVTNQSKYLNNLWAKDPSKKTWAAAEIKKLSDAANKNIVYSSDLGRKTGTSSTATDTTVPAATTPNDTALTDLYAEQLKGSQAAVNAGTDATVTEALNQQKALKPMYDEARSGAYVTGRIGAIGNNEALASQGLSGALYAAPTSGTSETSRISQNATMQQAINSFTKDEKNAVNTLDQEILKAKTAGNVELARLASENKTSLMAALIAKREKEAEQAKADYTANIGQFSNDYQAEIDRLGPNDPHIPELKAAQNAKIAANLAAAETLKQTTFENNLKSRAQANDDARLKYDLSKPYYSPNSSNTGDTPEEIRQKAIALYTDSDGLTDWDAVSKYEDKILETNTGIKQSVPVYGQSMPLSQIVKAISMAKNQSEANARYNLYAPFMDSAQKQYIQSLQ